MRLIPMLAILLFATPALADIVLPADVSGYFSRLNLCQDHPNQDKADLLLCNELPSDKKALLRKYADYPEIVEALNRFPVGR